MAASLGVLATMENPSNSYFWLTCWVKSLQQQATTYQTDFQVCMYGGSRDKWTKILANFKTIEAMDVRCNRAHQHAPWGFAINEEGQQVWATSLESRYPRKLCVVLTQLVLQVAENHQLHLPAVDLSDVQDNPLKTSQHSQIGALRQPKRLPPLVPDFASVATFLCEDVAQLPCPLQSKLPTELQLHTKAGRVEMVPKSSRLLRISAFQPDLTDGGEVGAQDADGCETKSSKRQRTGEGCAVVSSKSFPTKWLLACHGIGKILWTEPVLRNILFFKMLECLKNLEKQLIFICI